MDINSLAWLLGQRMLHVYIDLRGQGEVEQGIEGIGEGRVEIKLKDTMWHRSVEITGL